MKTIYLIIIAAAFAISFSSCDLDSNLFNPETLREYKLPGNEIPAPFIVPASFSSEGNKLYGFWIAGTRNGMTILYCHGNKHNIDSYWDRVNLLYKTGANIFIFDYRGFGMSEGTADEKSMYADGRAALEFVKSRPEYKADSLCLYGYSLGNVTSIYLASEVVSPLALFSECPFASANSLVQGGLALDIPAGWLTKGNFDNVAKIKNISSPLMLFHGADDSFVRFRDNGKLVFDAAPEPKKLNLVSGADHTDIPEKMGKDQYIKSINDWINYSITLKSRKPPMPSQGQ